MLRLKITSFSIVLCVIFNITFSAGILKQNLSGVNDIVPQAFGIILSMQAHIDIISNMVNHLLDPVQQSQAAPLETGNTPVTANNDFISLSLNLKDHKLSRNFKSSTFFMDNAQELKYTDNLISRLTNDKIFKLAMCLYLLMYLSLLYRDSWINNININNSGNHMQSYA